MNRKWISVKDKMPEKIGAYLCYTNDDLILTCFVAVNGWWNVIPYGRFYGDMGKIIRDSKEIDREVTHWMPFPKPPNT